ncbi:MAG TPA: EscU/YscU/HrcU family type III secretion system export apparatus switch protein [Albitalea sp.]
MSAESELDRSEAATPHKLAEARRRGQVAKSVDAVTAGVLAAAVVCLQARGWDAVQAQVRLARHVLAQAAPAEGSAAALWRLAADASTAALRGLAPALAVVMLAAIVAHVAQTGPVAAWPALSPQWDRLHPGQGLRRLCSGRTAFEALRASAKLAVLGGVLALGLAAAWPRLARLAALPPAALAQALLEHAGALGLQLALAMAVVALLDLAWTRRAYARRMRMSRRELRDEHRHREGDPRIRARLRALRRELLKRTGALRRTRDADLVVTNPTHYAVALRYRHGEMDAPQLVAKGAGALAAAMRVLAARHRVPVVRHPALARALYAQAGLGQHVPPGLYAEVARLVVWLLAARRARPGAEERA